MNQRGTFQHMLPILFGLVLVAMLGLLFLSPGNPLAPPLAFDFSRTSADVTRAEEFDLDQVFYADAMRWQAAADHYAQQGQMALSSFEPAEAAENMAFRWNAMGKFYEDESLLTRDNFDYEEAAENMAFRWQAMADAYARMGLLNEQ